MRKAAPFMITLCLSACADAGTTFNAIGTTITTATSGAQRGPVEVFVKTNHPALISDIRAGGGQTLTQAYDIAAVPQSSRDLHILRLQSDLALYASNLDALVTAIMAVSAA